MKYHTGRVCNCVIHHHLLLRSHSKLAYNPYCLNTMIGLLVISLDISEYSGYIVSLVVIILVNLPVYLYTLFLTWPTDTTHKRELPCN